MHDSLRSVEHRPWPLPGGPWILRQSWCDVLFVHWPVPAAALAPLVPAGLAIDTFAGTAWVGVVPFRMHDVAARGLPTFGRLSNFPEINLRLYVVAGDRPGVWFLSLDAASRLAVWIGCRLHLPYRFSAIDLVAADDGFAVRGQRRHAGESAAFAARYAANGPIFLAKPGSLEHFLTERYCLYAAAPDGTLIRGEVHHRPWPLQPARVEIGANSLGVGHGLDLAAAPQLVHFAKGVDVVAWRPRPLPLVGIDRPSSADR